MSCSQRESSAVLQAELLPETKAPQGTRGSLAVRSQGKERR